jgi:hypothetical protein
MQWDRRFNEKQKSTHQHQPAEPEAHAGTHNFLAHVDPYSQAEAADMERDLILLFLNGLD